MKTTNQINLIILIGLAVALEKAPAQTPEEPPKYAFDTPAGWNRSEKDWGTLLLSPQYSNGEVCQILVLPMRPASGDLIPDTLATFRSGFGAEPLTSYPSPFPRLEYGFATQGWEYFVIRKLLGGQSGDSDAFGAMLMQAKVGKWFATIVAVSKDPLVSNCLGEMVYDTWPVFLSSLRFENAKLDAVPEQEIRNWLTGTWLSATGTAGIAYTFAPNGRYSDAGTYVGPATVSEYFGNGSYSIEGSRIVMNPDGGSRSEKLFRFGMSITGERETWKDQMCMMDPGSNGEICFRRQ